MKFTTLFSSLLLVLLISYFTSGSTKDNRNSKDGYNIVDSIRIDINNNEVPGKFYILQLNNHSLRFYAELDNNKTISNDSLFFPIGYLYPELPDSLISQYVFLIENDKSLIIQQEYGSSNPKGWYLEYISYDPNKETLVLDSISHEWKNEEAVDYSDFLKRKTIVINKILENNNIIKEFDGI